MKGGGVRGKAGTEDDDHIAAVVVNDDQLVARVLVLVPCAPNHTTRWTQASMMY